MGIRLGVYVKEGYGEIKNKFYGTKLYGYSIEEKLLSYEFLQCIGKFDGTEDFNYSNENEIVLNREEFKLFCKLYELDLKNDGVEYSFIDDEDIQDLLHGDYRYYILNWG